MKRGFGIWTSRVTTYVRALGLVAALLPLSNLAVAGTPGVTGEIFAAPATTFPAPIERLSPISSSPIPPTPEPVVDWMQLLTYRAKSAGLSTSVASDDQYIGVADDAATAAKLSESQPGAWILKEGPSLHAALEAMAARAGWHLQWALSGVDYAVPSDVILFGGFEGADSVILQVMKAYQTADIPLKASFWAGNRTLVIDRAEFTQGGLAGSPANAAAPGMF